MTKPKTEVPAVHSPAPSHTSSSSSTLVNTEDGETHQSGSGTQPSGSEIQPSGSGMSYWKSLSQWKRVVSDVTRREANEDGRKADGT